MIEYQTNENGVSIDDIKNINTILHGASDRFPYHVKHIHLVGVYASIINGRLGGKCDKTKLTTAALLHDVMKEKSITQRDVFINGHKIETDALRYVRTNLDTLELFGMGDYFNTSVQYHPLAAALFAYKELGITDPEIIYPIMFHSCPIMPVYNNLTSKERMMVDIIMLADKLSSNYLRINFLSTPVRLDLDLAVFGRCGREFNYSLGLYLARLVGQGKSNELYGLESTAHYFNRLKDSNPLISKQKTVKKLGGSVEWPKRKSKVLTNHLINLKN